MTVWGIGGKWLFWSLLASAPVIASAYTFHDSLAVTAISPWWFYGAGVLLLLVGIPFWLLSAFTLKRAFESEALCTSGVFAVCRNPIYAAWIFFLVSGGLLFTRNPLLLAIPFIMYAVLRLVLPQEEAWLEEKYGTSYRDYEKNVYRILPSFRVPISQSNANQKKANSVINGTLTGIPETLLIALWARAAATQEAEPIIRDEKAVEMVLKIDYDFSRFESSNRFTKLGVAVRTMLLDNGLSAFLQTHPDAVVINFGAGLDTRHARMECKNVDWYEIDMPESIELRRQFFSETDRYHFIPQSMFDLSWIDGVKPDGLPVIFLAEGLFMYFSEEELKPFFCELAQRFPKSEMLFEMLAPFMVGKSQHHETLKKIDSQAEFKWGLRDSRDMESWHPAIRFIEEWNYYNYHRNRWGLFGTIARLPFFRPRLSCRIVHLRFDD